MLLKCATKSLRTELAVESLLALRGRAAGWCGEACGVVLARRPAARSACRSACSVRGSLALKNACIAPGFTHLERSTWLKARGRGTLVGAACLDRTVRLRFVKRG
jgi:hypothetical protein